MSFPGSGIGPPAGGLTRSVRVVPVTTATPDYADGDAMGGLLTFTDFVRASPGSGLITRAFIKSKVTIAVDVLLHLFIAPPSDSIYTDNGALTIHANDWPNLLKTVLFDSTDFLDMQAGLFQADNAVAIPYEVAEASTALNLYGLLESTGVINLASVSDLEVWLGQESN